MILCGIERDSIGSCFVIHDAGWARRPAWNGKTVIDGFAEPSDGAARGRLVGARGCGGAEREPVERGEVVTTRAPRGAGRAGRGRGGHVRPKMGGEPRGWLLQRTGQADFTIAAWSPSWPNAVCAWTTERSGNSCTAKG